jgi:signal transduction histidine kinase
VNEWIDAPDFKEFTDYLEEFGGIGIYRDGFSILPAQTAAKDDWLRLATRHIKKGSHISYYNLAGSIELLQEKNPHLVDRTSREGLLETRAYSDLGHLTRTIIFEVDAYVNATRERYSLLSQADRLSETSLTTQLQAAADVLKTLAEEYDLSKDPFGLRKSLGGRDNARNALDGFPTAFQQARRELSDVRDERNALLEAAGYGIAIAVAIHEIEKISSNLYFGLERLLNQAAIIKGKTYGQVQQLSDTSKSLLNELKRIAPLRVTRLEQPRQFSIRDSILAASSAFRLSWEELAITFIPPKKGADFEFQGSFGACTQVFANLFDNSTYWLRVSEGVRRIVVQALPDSRTVIVADTGSGIDERIRSHLFKPFFSLKVPPSGLGLYICKYYMVQMGGSIRESHDSERLPGLAGAHFTLRFPDKAAQR